MNPSISRLAILALALSFLATLMNGCKTTGSSSASRQPPIQIDLGMLFSEVVSLLGQPIKIEDTDPPMPDAEVWVYHTNKRTTTTMEATGTRETPYYDPITGQYKPIIDPVMSTVTTSSYQIVEITFSHNRVVSWNTRTVVDENYVE